VLTAGSGTITATPPSGAAPLSIAEKFTGTTLSNLPFAVTSINNNGMAAASFPACRSAPTATSSRSIQTARPS
jgi:hypothetical protein